MQNSPLIPAEDPLFTMPIKVRDYEVDSQGIVNNANYLHYFEHTRHEFCEHVGFSFRRMSEEGIYAVVRNIDITYLSPLSLGQSALSSLTLRRSGPRFIFRQWLTRPGGEPVAAATVTIVSTTRDGRLTRGDELAAAFNQYL